MFAAELFHLVYQSLGHFAVIYEINPAEAHLLVVPLLVGLVVDDGCNPSDKFTVLVCQVKFGIAELLGCTLLLIESINLVKLKGRYVVWIISI